MQQEPTTSTGKSYLLARACVLHLYVVRICEVYTLSFVSLECVYVTYVCACVVLQSCCAIVTILSRTLNVCYHRMCVSLCVRGFFFFVYQTGYTYRTTQSTERCATGCVVFLGYGCCWSSGVSTDPGTKREGERERSIHTYVSLRMKLHTHARNVKTAGPLLLHRSLLFAPLPFLLLSPSFCRPFLSCFSSLPLDYLTDKGYVNGDIRAG